MLKVAGVMGSWVKMFVKLATYKSHILCSYSSVRTH